MQVRERLGTNSAQGSPNGKQISKRDLFFWLLELASRTGRTKSYTRICKALYRMQEYLHDNHQVEPVYDFDDFMIHTGVFDNQLLRDFQTWEFLGLLKNQSFPFDVTTPKRTINSHDLTLTDEGRDYARRYARKAIIEKLGAKAFKDAERILLQYLNETESKLIDEANRGWAQKNAQREHLVEKFLQV
jgi:hypothetical protein